MNSKTKNIIAWIAQGLLSLMMLGAGAMKLMTPYGQLLNGEMGWIEDYSPMQVKVIGILEILGVVGMTLPFIIKKFKKYVPISAAALALTMVGALVTHASRGEDIMPPLVPLILAIVVIYFRKDLFSSKD